MMEGRSEVGYESELLAVFKQCDKEGQGLLDSEGLTQLCQMLHLEDNTESLISRLSLTENKGVSFTSFKTALLSLLSSSQQTDRTHSPDREVSPKYVYGQKKYGRRSRPEVTEYEMCQVTPLDDAETDTFMAENHSSDILINGDDISENNKTNKDNLESSFEAVSNGVTTPDKDMERGCSELRLVWDRMSSNGCLNKAQLAMVCSSVGMDTLADQVVAQVFSKLGREPDGLISFDEFLELVRGWSPPSSPPPIPLTPPPPLYSSPQQHKFLKSNCDVEMWDSTGINSSRLLHELQTARNLVEALTEERDKLRTDLADANHRATLLAQEVDEHHTRIERASQSKIKQLELKHIEEIKDIEKRFILEKEQLIGSNQKLEETVTKYLEQINKLSSEVVALKKEYDSLEKENRSLADKIKDHDVSKHELEKQLEYFDSLQQRMLEMESVNENIEKLRGKISTLQSENIELRDKNDELTSQLESAVHRSCHRREGSWGCVECNSVGGGGTKRRGKSPDWADTRVYHRLGKVRRCSTETDLFIAASHHPTNNNLTMKKGENSESGLETDIETITGSSPTLSHASLENADDYHEVEVEKLKSYITELEHQLDRYQMKEWEYSKLPVSDDESYQNPSIVTVKSEQTQVTSQSISNASDAMSYKSLGGNSEIKDNVSKGVQTGSEEDLQRKLELATEVIRDGCQGCQMLRELLNTSSVATPNFNDGIEWDSTERVAPPSLDFQPFQPVSKSNFLSCNNFKLPDYFGQLSSKLPQSDQTFDSVNLTDSLKCLNCRTSLDIDSREIEVLKEENRTLSERCKEFESSLELMRLEYEKTEDYWANKLDEERRLFEEDQLQSDEKFSELQLKIQEYAELFSNETSKRVTLPTIEEKDYLEKQVNDLEEEYEQFRLNAEEALGKKDTEINNLEKKLSKFISQDTEKQDVLIQTEKIHSQLSDSSESEEQSSFNDEECYKCQRRLSREISRKKELKSRLLLECQALELHKGQLLDQISSLRASSQMWNALTSKLRYQESICNALENSLRQQQKRTEQALHKAYERHKLDLMNVQNTLRMTREKLQNQSAITKQQLERLAEADSLVKELFIENAQLVAEVASLQCHSASDRIGPISL